MLLSTLPKCKITYVRDNQNKYVIKKTQIDNFKNETCCDGIQRRQLELQRKEKELCARELKLQEKARKFNQKAKQRLIQREIERQMKHIKKERKCFVDEAIKTQMKIVNFSDAPENIKFCKLRRSSSSVYFYLGINVEVVNPTANMWLCTTSLLPTQEREQESGF